MSYRHGKDMTEAKDSESDERGKQAVVAAIPDFLFLDV